LARTRIAVSPLWETVCSLMLLDRHPGRLGFPFEEWEIRARTALASDEARVVLREAYLGHPIFSRGALMCSSDHGDVIAASYQARGGAVLASAKPDQEGDGPARCPQRAGSKSS
jgi:hypothetical protein